jgi:hypothetical protein
MRALTSFPLFLILLVAYLLLAFGAPNVDGQGLSGTLLALDLFSGAHFKLTVNGIFLVLGVVFLFLEMVKSTRTGPGSVMDHLLSTLVFAAFLVTFVVMRAAGNETFFLLMLMSAVDVLAGFTVTLAAARRDLVVDR